jgi:hypothetical protein
MDQKDGFLQLDAVYFIREDRKGIQPKASQIILAVRMDGAGILVSAEFVTDIADDQGFFYFREQHEAADRRTGSGNQKPMVAARIESQHGGRGEASNSVGFEPLA